MTDDISPSSLASENRWLTHLRFVEKFYARNATAEVGSEEVLNVTTE